MVSRRSAGRLVVSRRSAGRLVVSKTTVDGTGKTHYTTHHGNNAAHNNPEPKEHDQC